VSRIGHLVRRFVGALDPRPVGAADVTWVASILEPAELALWTRMVRHDRRHSIVVARRVEHRLRDTLEDGDPRWLAAALLHDVGKLDSGLGVMGRVGATVVGMVGGRDRAVPWSAKRGIARRVGLYLRHGELGAIHIRVAGGRDEVARWTEDHHDPAEWNALDFPPVVVAALHDADDD
jgi:hypothetical protein